MPVSNGKKMTPIFFGANHRQVELAKFAPLQKSEK
jgi:hypothetical protein